MVSGCAHVGDIMMLIGCGEWVWFEQDYYTLVVTLYVHCDTHHTLVVTLYVHCDTHHTLVVTLYVQCDTHHTPVVTV